MKMTSNAPAVGSVTFIPTTEAERTLVERLIAQEPTDRHLKYHSRSGADVGAPYTDRMFLDFLLKDEGVKILATDDESEPVIRSLRDAIYFGGDGLHVINHGSIDGTPTVDVCVNFCKHCKDPISDMGRCEHETCDACADKCEHEYIIGHVHGGDTVLGTGSYCEKCGRGEPDTKPVVHLTQGETAVMVIALQKSDRPQDFLRV